MRPTLAVIDIDIFSGQDELRANNCWRTWKRSANRR